MIRRLKQWVYWCALWLMNWAQPSPQDTEDINRAIQYAMGSAGLNKELFHVDFDLSSTGKFHEVHHYACEYLARKHTLRTVGDLARHLQKGY